MDNGRSWPSDQVRKIKLKDLVPYDRNSRTHSSEQVEQLANSIQEWGFTNPILVDESNMIIAGHGRMLAAQKLGIDEVPCMVAKGWTDAQIKAYVIADNKLALNAGWDDSLLKLEIKNLTDMNFDLNLTGFSLDELGDLFFEPDFDAASEDDQGKLDELDPKMVNCPHCKQDFDLREHG